ncbi:hypothetical protein GCM10027299_22060 [Larkinella ripae]
MLIHAQEGQLEAVWNEIVGLLGIRHTETSYSDFMEDLRNLNDWMLREYPSLTWQELRLAYNMAVKGELDIEKVIPVLAPRYVGEIIKAYHSRVNNDPEVITVFRSQQHIDQTEPEKTQEEINEFMQTILGQAIETVQNGNDYPDPGNGLYDWLDSLGYLSFTKQQKLKFMADAEPQERLMLAENAADNTRHPQDRIRLKGLIGAVMKENKEFKDRVVARAKYLALNAYLKTIKF